MCIGTPPAGPAVNGAGTRALIEVLLAHRALPSASLIAAMDAAVAAGTLDPAAVVIDARRHAAAPVAPVVPMESVARYDPPGPRRP